VKFTAEGAVTVDVSFRPGDQRIVRVEVADSGIGIDPAALDRLFEPFTQATRRRRVATAARASAWRSPASWSS